MGKAKSESSLSTNSGVKMKKELALIDGVAIIVGIIIGSGIFVSPKGVLRYSGSVGQAIIVWILSGLLSMIGALCYAELGAVIGSGIFIAPKGVLYYSGSIGLSLIIWTLSGLISALGSICYTELGTMIPKSGGDYAYISEAFGPLPAFLYLWVALFILVPTGNAITAITFAQYILQPLWPTCQPPYEAVRLLAAATTCILTVINCYNVKWVTRVQDVFTATKIFALCIIVIAGIYYLCIGHVEHFADPMAETNTKPGFIALAFYSGLFSYSGWNYLNYVTEELKDPYRNLPRAICISMPIVTITYVVTNIAYFVVLSREEILASNAVAVTFGDKMLGGFSFLMPFFVACSTFGSLNGAIFASSRLFFVGARQGHLPRAIALINVKRLTPIPSLIFMCLITLFLTIIEDVYVLINYVSFVESLFIMVSVTGLIWMRYKRPEMVRPIRVNMILPILFFIICAFLVTFPCYDTPVEVGVGVALILCGIPVYYATIAWTNKPAWMVKWYDNFTNACAKLFICVPEDAHTS